ncbi:MAG: hypothetical protein PHQ70_06950 [Arcobacter sp.]|uniref:hypothetical protein n=1 Tax=Arcobacter sp. TaxID=1872629 RepID=UPI002590AE64|nr:hypothetical protein [Arcobacter sp.]MDD3008593.1 hypothetical protein [Arcobacter sp.]
MENEILNLLLETLKIQAQKYKIIVDDDSLTHEQRKEFDTEITQMYNVLANLSNSSTIYTLAELKGLKAQYDVKFAEFDEKVANLDLSHLLVSFDSLTQEQKDSLKGQNGLSAFDIAVNNGFEGSEPEWLESLKGIDGQDAESAIFDFDTLDTVQKNKIVTFVFQSSTFTDLLQRIDNLENNSGSTPTTPETPTTDFINPFEIENSIYSFNKLSDNELLIRVLRTSQINDYNMLVTNLSLNVADIEKIDYKVVKSYNPLEVSTDLSVLNAPESYETFTYILDSSTTYPTALNAINVEYMENLGSSFANYDNLASTVANELKAYIAVINGQLLIIADRNINASCYIENILITLKSGHSADISNVSILASGLLTGAHRLLYFNITEYDTFVNDVSDLIPPAN